MQYAVQFNAMQVSSIPFDLLRFDSMYLSQSKANSVSFHFMSCQFTSIKCLHPTPAANWTSILHCTFQTFRASSDFPCRISWRLGWALPQAPAKDGWSTDQTSPTDLCKRSCWTSVLDSLGLFLTRLVNVCKYIGPCLGVTVTGNTTHIQEGCHSNTQTPRPWAQKKPLKAIGWVGCSPIPKSPKPWAQKRPLKAIGWASFSANIKSAKPWAQKRPLKAIGWARCTPNLKSAKTWAQKRPLKAIGWARCTPNLKSAKTWAQKRPLKAIGWASCSPNAKSPRPWAQKRPLMAIGWPCCPPNLKSAKPWAQKRPLKAIGWACFSPNPMSSRWSDHAEVRSARISESFRWYQTFGARYFSGTSQTGDFGMNCPARWA